jgi:hypothetical protein
MFLSVFTSSLFSELIKTGFSVYMSMNKMEHRLNENLALLETFTGSKAVE